jgi:pimeloyl-ACP methyl ester carboxylesterase
MALQTLPWLVALAAPPLLHAAYAAWVRRRFPRAGETLEHAGVPLHFARHGSGPPVVLVHGANGTWHDFPPDLIADLARDHTVLAFDRPGHGWSGAPRGPLGLGENAAALLALLRAQGAMGATLVGHSYGAAVALRAALEAPDLVRHVVAVTPCTAIDPRNRRYARAPLVAEPVGRVLFQYLSLALVPFGLPLRADAWHPHRAPRGWAASRAFAYVPSQMHASARNFRTLAEDMAWLAERLPGLTPRLTVLAGEHDRVTPPERHVEWLREALPSARIEVLPVVGHWLVRLRTGQVARAVRASNGDGNGAQPEAANGR